MELYQLKYFESVARFESVSKAAEHLHISQPALSKAIAKLESELGVELFDRVGKRLQLNDRGASFLENASQLLTYANESVSSVRQEYEAFTESVSIAVRGPQKEALACTIAFMAQNPEVRINLDVKRTKDKKSAAWTSDIVFAPMGTPFDSSIGIPYATRRLALAVPEGHRFAELDAIDLGEAKGEPFVLLTSPYEVYELSYQLCMDSGFTPAVHVTTGSKPALFEFVRKGMGVSLVDGETSSEGVEGIRIINLTTDAPIRSLCFACRSPENLTPAAQRYVKFMFNYFNVPMSKLEMAIFDRK